MNKTQAELLVEFYQSVDTVQGVMSRHCAPVTQTSERRGEHAGRAGCELRMKVTSQSHNFSCTTRFIVSVPLKSSIHELSR